MCKLHCKSLAKRSLLILTLIFVQLGCQDSQPISTGEGLIVQTTSEPSTVFANSPQLIENERFITLNKFQKRAIVNEQATVIGFDLISSQITDDEFVNLLSGFRDELEVIKVDASSLSYSLPLLKRLDNLKSITIAKPSSHPIFNDLALKGVVIEIGKNQ